MNAAVARVARGVGVVRAKILFRGCTCGPRIHASGPVHVVAKGHVHLGERVQFVGGTVATSLVCETLAEIVVGARTVLNYGAYLHAHRSICIGERCMIASMVSIRDADGHRVEPVVVGDDVWIAHGALIEPGVTIGDRSVVSAGSVVCRDVPPDSVAMGNPATTMPLAMLRRNG